MLPNLFENALIGSFISDLKKLLQVEVLAYDPISILEVHKEAKVAEKNLALTCHHMKLTHNLAYYQQGTIISNR